MINRELSEREKELLGMIKPTTFQEIVDIVRKDVQKLKYDAKKKLRYLHNDVIIANDKVNDANMVNVTNITENIGEITTVLIKE
jgi:hypothetical protein